MRVWNKNLLVEAFNAQVLALLETKYDEAAGARAHHFFEELKRIRNVLSIHKPYPMPENRIPLLIIVSDALVPIEVKLERTAVNKSPGVCMGDIHAFKMSGPRISSALIRIIFNIQYGAARLFPPNNTPLKMRILLERDAARTGFDIDAGLALATLFPRIFSGQMADLPVYLVAAETRPGKEGVRIPCLRSRNGGGLEISLEPGDLIIQNGVPDYDRVDSNPT